MREEKNFYSFECETQKNQEKQMNEIKNKSEQSSFLFFVCQWKLVHLASYSGYAKMAGLCYGYIFLHDMRDRGLSTEKN